jgi:integrase
MPKNLKKRGRIWWYKIRYAGRDFEGSLETEHTSVAKERFAKTREQLISQRWGESSPKTFNEAAERFASEHFQTLKAASARRYVTSMKHLLELFDGMLLEDISSARLSELEQVRRRDGVTTSSIRRDLACLSVIYSCAEEWEWIKYNPVKPFLRGRAKRGLIEGAPRTRYLSQVDECELLTHAPAKACSAITFAIDTGLRKEEQFSLRWSDIDLEASEIHVRAEVTKNGRSRNVPLLDRSLNLLRQMRSAPTSTFVFSTLSGERYSPSSPTNYEALQKACRRAGLKEHVAWHDLRRTCGCRLLQNHGLTMVEVSKWLGHSSVLVTERHYAFLDKQALHKALARNHGAKRR